MKKYKFIFFNLLAVVMCIYSYHQMMELMFNLFASLVFILSIILWTVTIDYMGICGDKMKCKQCKKEVNWLSALSERCRDCILKRKTRGLTIS